MFLTLPALCGGQASVKNIASTNWQGTFCAGADLKLNSIWTGTIDKKVVVKPAPLYPALTRSVGLRGLVAVVVVVDTTGKVIGAQAVSGHPLLRKSAEDAARQARFAPANVCAMPFNVSGLLTYSYGL